LEELEITEVRRKFPDQKTETLEFCRKKERIIKVAKRVCFTVGSLWGSEKLGTWEEGKTWTCTERRATRAIAQMAHVSSFRSSAKGLHLRLFISLSLSLSPKALSFHLSGRLSATEQWRRLGHSHGLVAIAAHSGVSLSAALRAAGWRWFLAFGFACLSSCNALFRLYQLGVLDGIYLVGNSQDLIISGMTEKVFDPCTISIRKFSQNVKADLKTVEFHL
jgi:hypothetical protein